MAEGGGGLPGASCEAADRAGCVAACQGQSGMMVMMVMMVMISIMQ